MSAKLAALTKESPRHKTCSASNTMAPIAANPLYCLAHSPANGQRADSPMQEADAALVSISDSINNITNLNLQIAAAAEQQSVVASDVDRNAQSINTGVVISTENSQVVSASAVSIQKHMNELVQIVREFRV